MPVVPRPPIPSMPCQSLTGPASGSPDYSMIRRIDSAATRHGSVFERYLEAPPGFEPGMEVLQTGSAPLSRPCGINDLTELLRKSRPSPLSTITWITLRLLLIGTMQGQWIRAYRNAPASCALPVVSPSRSSSAKPTTRSRSGARRAAIKERGEDSGRQDARRWSCADAPSTFFEGAHNASPSPHRFLHVRPRCARE